MLNDECEHALQRFGNVCLCGGVQGTSGGNRGAEGRGEKAVNLMVTVEVEEKGV